MPPMTTMLLAPALAPLTGTDPQSIAVRDLARALQQSDWQVTVVVGVDESADTNRIGLARRLEPVTVGDAQCIVHEGSIEGGHIQLLAVQRQTDTGVALPEPDLCLLVALQLMEAPRVIQLWSQTRSALNTSQTLSPPPVSVVHLEDAVSAEGLSEADLLLLPSRVAARQEQRNKESALLGHLEKLHGLAPGLDEREWNPARDSLLVQRLEPPTTESKAAAKAALQAELGLKRDELPLIGVVAPIPRLPRTVGEELLKLPVQFAGIGAGPHIEAMASRSPQKAACPRPVSDYEQRQLQHRILAAADFVLMPGSAEPVSQLFPCRYGAAVIAPMQGEFAERLVNFDPRSRTGTGFLYREEHELINAVRQAIAAWQAGPETRAALIERCLQLDLSWETQASRLSELVAPLL